MGTKLTTESLSEFVGQIVDGFEDYLEGRGIILENAERDEAIKNGEYDNSEETAIIYGRSYDIIGDTVLLMVAGHDMLKGNAISQDDMEIIVREIMASFYVVLIEGKTEDSIPEEDAAALKNYIRKTFTNWGLFT